MIGPREQSCTGARVHSVTPQFSASASGGEANYCVAHFFCYSLLLSHIMPYLIFYNPVCTKALPHYGCHSPFYSWIAVEMLLACCSFQYPAFSIFHNYTDNLVNNTKWYASEISGIGQLLHRFCIFTTTKLLLC